jgi:hypothetical protein
VNTWIRDLEVLEFRSRKGFWNLTAVDDNNLTDNIKETNHLSVCEPVLSCLIHTYNITGLDPEVNTQSQEIEVV